MAAITLREVARALIARLGKQPVKTYWREEKSNVGGSSHVQVYGVELKFNGLKPDKVASAMQGLERTEKRKFKHGKRAYRWIYRWEHKSEVIKFRVTLFIDTNNDEQLFVFTTTW